VIREGIEYVRAVLRRCERKIISDLGAFKVEDEQAREIAVLLSQGPLVSLKPQSLDILTRIIERRRSDILAAVREYRRCATKSKGPKTPDPRRTSAQNSHHKENRGAQAGQERQAPD